MAAKTRRVYSGSAVATTITAAFNAGATSTTITATTGWPYGANPFYVVVSPGTANEEKVLVTRTGSGDTQLDVVSGGRGADGTSDVNHGSGASIYPVFTAVDADEANEMASELTTKGDVLSLDSAGDFTRLAVGTNDYVLVADSGETTGLKWAQVDTAGIADSAVTSAKIADGTIVNGDVSASAALAHSKLASATAGYVLLGNSSNVVTATQITGDVTVSDAGVTSLAANSVDTAELVDGAVTAAKLNGVGASTSFTPVWTNVTVGNGTNTGRYFRINDVILMQAQLVFGSTTSISAGGVLLDFPVAAADTYLDGSNGQVVCEDVTGADYFGPTFRSSGTKFGVNVWSTSGAYLAASTITSTVPFTWATGDRLIVTQWYKAA